MKIHMNSTECCSVQKYEKDEICILIILSIEKKIAFICISIQDRKMCGTKNWDSWEIEK